MTVRGMDHVGVVVENLAAAIGFFTELGLELEDETSVEGPWVDRIVGLDRVRSDIAMMRTPDGRARLELTKFQTPQAVISDPNAPANATGIRHLTFRVDDIDEVLARLRRHGAELVGDVEQYGNSFRLCYLRGPAGIIVELTQPLS